MLWHANNHLHILLWRQTYHEKEALSPTFNDVCLIALLTTSGKSKQQQMQGSKERAATHTSVHYTTQNSPGTQTTNEGSHLACFAEGELMTPRVNPKNPLYTQPKHPLQVSMTSCIHVCAWHTNHIQYFAINNSSLFLQATKMHLGPISDIICPWQV